MNQLVIQFDSPMPSSMPAIDARNRKIALAMSAQVKNEVLSVYASRPGEYLFFDEELLAIKRKYDLGIFFNDTIRALHKDGLIEERKVYLGAESPVGTTDLAGKRKLKKGEKPPLPYLGFRREFRYADRGNA